MTGFIPAQVGTEHCSVRTCLRVNRVRIKNTINPKNSYNSKNNLANVVQKFFKNKKEFIHLLLLLFLAFGIFFKIPQKVYLLFKSPQLKEFAPIYLNLIEKGFKEDAKQMRRINFKVVNSFGYENYGSFIGMTKTVFIHFIYFKKNFLERSLDEQSLMVLHELTHVKQNEKFFNVPFFITWTDFIPQSIFKHMLWDDLLEFEALYNDLENLKKFPDIDTEYIQDKIKILNIYGNELLGENWINIEK